MEVTKSAILQFPKINESNPVVPKETIAPEENNNEHAEKPVTKKAIVDKVDSMNEFLEATSTNVKFQLHEELEVYYVQVIDSKTDEVLREIPNKKFLDMYASMAGLAGLIVDEKL
ncbi:flagellar biosynthesis protein FlaG [Planococcus antarcticus DSM 14505]|uniref:Flagellar biosynthesis protein FlaG n=1 Tax=Planococcus antarcticus DSM 14505 TaxID=1185653 RepID=A0ABM6D1K6_9BACL|nr:flagellar protein FlaG [Planococcus antarcticus]ANU09193.1 flagellar biosynthesis protein FlaG [Planococcus antarcticus DSM 14505]